MASPQSLFLRIQYPQSIGLLSNDVLDTFLTSLQKSQPLFSYSCTLNTLMFPDNETVPMDTPSLYCKTAPAYALQSSDQLVPIVLVELIFVTAVPATEASSIISVIDDTIRKQLLSGKADVSIRILVTSLSSGLTQKTSFGSNHYIPLPYYQVHDSAPKVNYSVILLAIVCLGILLLNFALNFHLNHGPLT